MDAEDDSNLSGTTSTASRTKPHPRSGRTSKYAGVTFRSSRDKFQARIYKGNKEFNLGLFDVAADAALAYDVTHRLVKKITEKEILESYEADKKIPPHWLEFGDTAVDESDVTETNKLNFSTQRDYLNNRANEINDNLSSGTNKFVKFPEVEEVRSIICSVAIRVVKTIIGAIDGGTNNYRKRCKSKKMSMDKGSMTEKISSKKRKKNTVYPTAYLDSMPTMVASSHARVGDEGAYTQWNGFGMQYPNPSRSKIELPIVSSPFVPMDFFQRHNQDIVNHLGNPRFQCNVDDCFFQGPSPAFNTNKAYDEALAKCGNDIKNNFLLEANQVGPSAFFDMGLGYQNGVKGGDINHHGLHAMLESSDSYRDLFSNVRDFATNSTMGSGLGGTGQHNVYGALPDDLKRMMLMMAMGQNSGVLSNAENVILGVNYPFGGMYSNGLCDQTKESIELGYLPNLNDVKAGLDSQAYDVHQGVLSGQNLQSFPSSLLHMSQTGGALNNAWNRNPVASMRDQPVCLEDSGQSAWQSAQCALNREGYDGLSSEDQPSLVHSLSQFTGIPSTTASDGGGEENSASNDVTFYAKLQERNTNISSNNTS